MEVNRVNRPQFRLLPSKKLEELHGASLHILEKTGVIVDAEEAFELLADAGASVSNGNRIRIPSSLVEEALRSTPKNITLYTRDGEPCIYLDRRHAYFGAIPDCPDILDPYTRERRPCYAADTASLVRLIDYLPNKWATVLEKVKYTRETTVEHSLSHRRGIFDERSDRIQR